MYARARTSAHVFFESVCEQIAVCALHVVSSVGSSDEAVMRFSHIFHKTCTHTPESRGVIACCSPACV